MGGHLDLLERLHHDLADATRRCVDDAPQAHIVVGINDEPHVGERVLHFLAFIEADAANDLVRQPFPHHRVFDGARLRVGAVQDGDGRIGGVGQAAARRARDEVGFLKFVAAAEVDDARAALQVGPQPLLLAIAVLANHGGGRVENHLRRAIVPLELHRHRFGVVALEVEDVLHVGAAPLVDRLVGIADDAEVAVDLRDAPDEHVLRAIRVLVLVHHNETELLRVLLANHG